MNVLAIFVFCFDQQILKSKGEDLHSSWSRSSSSHIITKHTVSVLGHLMHNGIDEKKKKNAVFDNKVSI